MGCDIHIVPQVRQAESWKSVDAEIPDDRNYWAFAILAGVRNKGFVAPRMTGFLESDGGDPVTPISAPRGLPDGFVAPLDGCDDSEDGEEVSRYMGDHSFSFVTLAELLALDLDAPIVERGLVSPEAHEKWLRDGLPPDSWCAGTNAPGHVELRWTRPLREAAYLLPKIIEALKPLGEPEDVRIVFGFDS